MTDTPSSADDVRGAAGRAVSSERGPQTGQRATTAAEGSAGAGVVTRPGEKDGYLSPYHYDVDYPRGVPTFGLAPEAGLPAQTLAELREIAGRYPQPQSGLLPMLHLVQSVEGCVTRNGIEACAEILGLSTAEVTAVATFYTMYKRHPVGEYHVGVCTNTLCAIMGGDAILERLEKHLEIGNDETTEDGAITLEHIECNAACDYAPVMTVNWEFIDNQTPDSAVQLVEDLRAGREVQSSRGARICTWRQAERVLAGFPDDRADEGPAAGPASLVGLELARQRHWTAPPIEASAEPPPMARSDAVAGVEESDASRAESETKMQAAAGGKQDALFGDRDGDDNSDEESGS